jgi:Phospholipase_D-nuclease N-terminal
MLFVMPFVVIILASFVLWVIALVDVVRRQFGDPNAKIIWVLVIVLAHGLGAAIYLIVGRKQGSLPNG